MSRFVAILVLGLMLSGCYPVVDITRTYAQWVSRFAEIENGTSDGSYTLVSGQDIEALRDDFVTLMEKADEADFQKALKRIPSSSDIPLVYRSKSTLYVQDFDPYFGLQHGTTCQRWRVEVSDYWGRTPTWSQKPMEEKAFFAFVAMNFDEVFFEDGLDAPDRIDLKGMRPQGMP